jgi:hypothetical protein
MAWSCVLAWSLVFLCAQAHAVITHTFLPEPSKTISKGVPSSCASPCLPGPLSGVNALTADSGHLWVAERSEAEGKFGTTLVDEFDDSSGAFLRQLNEEEGVSFLDMGVAVGRPEGEEEVYVGAAQEGKYVVAVFGPSGKLQHTWTGAHAPGERFGAITGVAVDTSPSLETQGDVFVAANGLGEASLSAVDVFKPKAGGEEPASLVGQLTGTPSGPFCEPQGVAVSPLNGDVLVSDVVPKVPPPYVFSQCFEGERQPVVDVFEPSGLPGKYSFSRAITGSPHGAFKSVRALAVDSGSGNIYVVDHASKVVYEFNKEDKYEGRLTGTPAGPFRGLESVAVDPVSHHVFVGDHNEETGLGAIDAFGPDLTIPDVETLPATEVSPESAQLNGTVNPRGAGEASCTFVWGESETLGNVAECPSVPSGEATVPVSATLKGLSPDTKYFYRLQASNANGTNTGEEAPAECEGKPSLDACFTTPGPGIRGEWTSEVSSTSATLNATVDPHGAPTEVFFEYGPTTGYGAKTPTPPAAIGSGEEAVHVEAHIQALTAGTVYHYRTVTVSGFGELHGSDQTFTTQGTGGGALVLPDARRWELVSPPDKRGAMLGPIGNEVGNVTQSSASGAAMTYLGSIPTEERAQGYFSEAQVLSVRGPGGWSSQNISLPHATPTAVSIGAGEEYRFVSEDLSLAVVEPFGQFTSLAPEVSPPDSERTPYVRHNSSCVAEPATCFRPLATGAPGYANVPEGTRFGGVQPILGSVNFVGATPDLARVVLSSVAQLTSAETGGGTELYEWSGTAPPQAELSLVSVLPPTTVEREKGEAGKPAVAAKLGSGGNAARHAVSDDGSRVVWSIKVVEGGKEGEHIYVRDTVKKQTLQLDLPESGCECGGGVFAPQFQTASRDGSKVFFTDSQRLTRDSRALDGKPDLYECEVVEIAGEPQCRISDLTPSSGEAADVQGSVLGASDDGSWLYFVANGVLGEGAKQGAMRGDCAGSGGEGAGTCTLYVWHDGMTLPIAVLSGEDGPDWAQGTLGGLYGLTARVSSTGGWLAFMSKRSLTGHDNRDAVSGRSDEEVYLYRARASGSGRLEAGALVCASCGPTGARPVGAEYGKLALAGFNQRGVWPPGAWIAANIPTWNVYAPLAALYQPRYLSDEGRLSFNSSDALVPQDINNNVDTYEYEPAGVGGCSTSSRTFSERSGGCVALISSGTAAGESVFLDASESGDDVFFLTSERLVSRDVDGAFDVYDAHVCSTVVPCLGESTSPPACATAAACRAAPMPQPQVFGSPASATVSGVGNLAPSPPSKSLTRAQKLTKALTVCRKKYRRHRRRRAVCERQAHKRYPAKQSGRATRRSVR